MKELRQAIITEDGKYRCPVCNKLNGELTGNEVVKNLKIRCRGSNGRLSHYFVLNVEREVESNV